jgi:dTDP-4-dehydrorhamnose 3,5-epimerase
MKFTETRLPGAYIIDIEPREDSRGHFARLFCADEFRAQGLPTTLVQASMSFTRRAGTLRGMHWQAAPHEEDKLVRCMRGAIWDAIVDLRPRSPTFCQWIGVELSEENGRMLLVPKGFAHGFVTLTDDAAAHYQMTTAYAPQAERGARHDDPAFGIEWPVPIRDISDKDRHWPAFDASAARATVQEEHTT